jgi:hypothetical protein
MNEPTKENPKPSKRSKRRPAMEPLGWDEIVSQPGMGGYLSFLNGPVPLPHLQGPAAGSAPNDHGIASNPGVDPILAVYAEPETVLGPGVDLTPVAVPARDPVIIPGLKDALTTETTPGVAIGSGSVLPPAPLPTPGHSHHAIDQAPEVVTIPLVPAHQRLRIRRCTTTYDGHSLGEEVLYQALWKAARPESAETRTIVIGWRGMSQLCRMTPKNCKINTQRLIRKLALEVLSPYNTPESIGTTYRVYSGQAILQRRREVGLEWVVRSRGVEFVDPATGISILPICAHTYQNGPR